MHIKIFLTIFLSLPLLAFNFEKINTFEADFSQSITNHSGKEISYSGKVFIKKPLQILWQYNEPIQKNVFLINTRVTIIEPDLEQVIISTLENEINILDILQNGEKIDANTYKSFVYNKPYLFSIKDDQLKQIEYKDDVDNKVVITFKNIVQNQPIKDSIYKYNIPTDYDVIRK
jgi:outer membrane lipoprotein carrier protein